MPNSNDKWVWNPAEHEWVENPEWNHIPALTPVTPLGVAGSNTAAMPQYFTPQYLGGGGLPQGVMMPNVPWTSFADTPSTAGGTAEAGVMTAAMAKSYQAMKDEVIKTQSKKESWHDHLGKYPKAQTDKTPLDDRVCVVAGKQFKATSTDDWVWYTPYWVRSTKVKDFLGIMTQCCKTHDWFDARLAARVHNEGDAREEWLKKNGYVQLGPQISRAYIKSESCFVYYSSSSPGKELLAPNDLLKNFPVCGVMARRYYSNEFEVVETIDGPKHISREGIKKSKDVKECCGCGHLFKEPLIGVWAPSPEISPGNWCVKCKAKQMEKNVIRAHDNCDFLDPMPDIIVSRLRGKVVREKNPRMYGVELEVGFNTGERAEVAMDVWETLGKDFCYIKHDGSITKAIFEDGYKVKNVMKMGFEIVTAPAGVTVHRERWKALAKVKNFKLLRAWDADSCGLHVHVSRKALTWLQVGRILVFVNHANNRYFIEVVAGRNSNYYTRYIVKEFTDCAVVDESKYMAVRTNKPGTIEFRIFRSTVNYRHIMRNIEFVEALCDFCAPCVTSLRGILDFRQFIEFVGTRRSHYPILSEWLATIDVIAKKKLPDPKYSTAAPLEEALSDAVQIQLREMMDIIGQKAPLKDILAKPVDCKKKAKKKADYDNENF